METADWFFKVGHQVTGPLSHSELQWMVSTGQLGPDTLVRRGDDVEWVPVQRVQHLFNEPHVAKPPGRDLPTFVQQVEGPPKLVPKMKRGPSEPGTDPPLPPSLPGRQNRTLVPVLLSILIVVASVSAVSQVCILRTLAGIASKQKHGLDVNVTNRELPVDVQNYELPVNVNSTIDVNVENSTLDVNVENRTLDVNVENHGITDGDPIPVRAVR